MSLINDKLNLLRSQLLTGAHAGGALLVIYPPEEELSFRAGYEEVIQELKAQGVQIAVLDFRTLVFDSLKERNLLERAFKLDAEGSPDARRSLASLVQREAVAKIQQAAKGNPNVILLCKHTAALFPWISYSALLEAIEGKITNTLVIPFPGTENGPALHFLGVKDGYNYRAARI
ncbi:hypothetical protein BECAL_01122 [Bellilinea caldifistulae]|uniref:DUF1788 domain-containing protein n=1 Tax=Bellilinea caldifistulae TaxID=360411 RepID=A0A0P6XWE1_9CHLR|nr:BREX protein BrxB domain-containing protein [Bellilinea caldifistulae]KPL77743.1 hypothetical protein AC812_02530 [Bellilinea caldifistulae]GAP09968.1 hypothetical protein BECAL_01122 [Bellilinea caldifistulae]